MLGQHVRCRLRNDMPIAVEGPARRTVAAAVLSRSEAFGLLAFGLADTHLHLLCRGGRGEELARRIEIALTRRLRCEIGFARVRAEAVRDQWHLQNAFGYVLRQEERHGLPRDPWAEGTNLPDLLGARMIGAHTCRAVRAALPRISRAGLLQALGVPALEPRDGPLEQIAAAAAAALCLPALAGKGDAVRAARRAAIEIVDRRLAPSQIGELLAIDRGTVRRLRRQRADPRLVQAIRLQLGLRAAGPRGGFGAWRAVAEAAPASIA